MALGSVLILLIFLIFGVCLTAVSWMIYDNINSRNTCKKQLKQCNQGVLIIGMILVLVPSVMLWCGCWPDDDDDLNSSMLVSFFAALGFILLILGMVISRNYDGCGKKVKSLARWIWGIGLFLFLANLILLTSMNWKEIQEKFKQPELTDAQRAQKAQRKQYEQVARSQKQEEKKKRRAAKLGVVPVNNVAQYSGETAKDSFGGPPVIPIPPPLPPKQPVYGGPVRSGQLKDPGQNSTRPAARPLPGLPQNSNRYTATGPAVRNSNIVSSQQQMPNQFGQTRPIAERAADLQKKLGFNEMRPFPKAPVAA